MPLSVYWVLPELPDEPVLPVEPVEPVELVPLLPALELLVPVEPELDDEAVDVEPVELEVVLLVAALVPVVLDELDDEAVEPVVVLAVPLEVEPAVDELEDDELEDDEPEDDEPEDDEPEVDELEEDVPDEDAPEDDECVPELEPLDEECVEPVVLPALLVDALDVPLDECEPVVVDVAVLPDVPLEVELLDPLSPLQPVPWITPTAASSAIQLDDIRIASLSRPEGSSRLLLAT